MFIWLSVFCWTAEPLLGFPAPCVPPSHCAAIRSLVLWLAAAFSRRFASNMSCSASFCFFIICLLLLQRFSFLRSLQTFLFLFISGCGLFLERWQIFNVSYMCAMKPTNQISSDWYLFHFLVFVDGIFDSVNCRNCVLLQLNSCFVDKMLVNWKSSLHITLYTRLLSPQPSDCCILNYVDHPSVWLPVTSTRQLIHHGHLVFLPIPVVYQHLLDTISIRWTLNQENSSCMPGEVPMQPVVSSFEWCLDFFSWKATDTECWTWTCSAKAIFLGDICWNVSGTGSYPYEAVGVEDSYLPSVSSKKLTFNCFSWHLWSRDATPWDHWLIMFTPLKVVTDYRTQFIRVLHETVLKYRIYRTFSQNIGQYRTFSKI